ncbi:Crp/Fnr family transcriptional regulator [Novosphingobium terrae]|uniref:Crp/Fnr family transcriptional regulator n=1 Tax=Novosphingobium terrae TaxID=2726189 RepID=UPI00197E92FA|nr:Crp/Fnr family transcriptional regulator [Novosphingobium terrae]
MQPPYHRLEEFVPLTQHELTIARGWLSDRRQLARGHCIRREGDPVHGVFFLLEGWVGSSLILRGGKRQIAKIHLPGDMLGFPSLSLSKAVETLEAVTDITFCTIPNLMIGRMFENAPRLSVAMFLSSQLERVALMQNLSWVGAASAMERVTTFLLDLHDRLQAAHLVKDAGFDFPLTQVQVGELLGLTPVHVNRTFRRLDETGYIERERGHMIIKDAASLRRLTAGFVPDKAGHAAWDRLGQPS